VEVFAYAEVGTGRHQREVPGYVIVAWHCGLSDTDCANQIRTDEMIFSWIWRAHAGERLLVLCAQPCAGAGIVAGSPILPAGGIDYFLRTGRLPAGCEPLVFGKAGTAASLPELSPRPAWNPGHCRRCATDM